MENSITLEQLKALFLAPLIEVAWDNGIRSLSQVGRSDLYGRGHQSVIAIAKSLVNNEDIWEKDGPKYFVVKDGVFSRFEEEALNLGVSVEAMCTTHTGYTPEGLRDELRRVLGITPADFEKEDNRTRFEPFLDDEDSSVGIFGIQIPINTGDRS